MSGRYAVSVGEIVARLCDRAEEVCHALFPNGRRDRQTFAIGSVEGEPGQSLRVYLRGRKPGVWRDFAESHGTARGQGDILDLIAQARCGGNKAEAIEWAKEFLGIAPISNDRGQRERDAMARAEAAALRKRQEDRSRQEDDYKRGLAYKIWNEASPDVAGSPVDLYLRGRGIHLKADQWPGSIRFHGDLFVSGTGEFLPGMVAVMSQPRPDGSGKWRFGGVHRTFLEADGRGGYTKATVKSPKRVLGPVHGCHIGLNKGASGKPISQAGEGETIVVVEGIEDGLACRLACPELRIVAAISLGNMATIVLPRSQTRILVRDNDEHPQAVAAFDRALVAHVGQCGDVRIGVIPNAKDAADLLAAGAR